MLYMSAAIVFRDLLQFGEGHMNKRFKVLTLRIHILKKIYSILKKFQPMASVLSDNSLLSNQDTNRFLV